jgi:hypothetical protein
MVDIYEKERTVTLVLKSKADDIGFWNIISIVNDMLKQLGLNAKIDTEDYGSSVQIQMIVSREV